MPEPFRGVWLDTPQHCKDELSDTYLKVEAGMLTFYESSGVVRAIDQRGPRQITVSAQMKEEGERWNATFEFLLSEDGQKLVDITEPHHPLDRVKCGGAGLSR